MPYSSPTTPSMIPSVGRPTHRRAYSGHGTPHHHFSTEKGPGAFVPLAIPRRQPVFHFHRDQPSTSSSSSSSDSEEEQVLSNVTPPLKLKKNLNLTIEGIPFPRSSPSPSPLLTPSPPPERVDFPASKGSLPKRPAPSRTTSTPILLSNGKPLKSSLKSSSSSPNFPIPKPAPSYHLRARSAPSTPHFDATNDNDDDDDDDDNTSCYSGTSTPKNVHFSTTDLETVRVFNRTAKPASLLGDETETETEGEHTHSHGASHAHSRTSFPFPKLHDKPPVDYELDLTDYPIPTLNPSPNANVYLESLTLDGLTMSGTMVTKNIAFTKHVYVRFTLDDWQTTSEVAATYLESLPRMPAQFLPKTLGDLIATATDTAEIPWDRFRFVVKLEDYAAKLDSKVLWLVGRYTVPHHGEWWDNNGSRNYRVTFKRRTNDPVPGVFQSGAPVAHDKASPILQDHHERKGEQYTKRLSGFKLLNYAAPVSKTPSPTSSVDSTAKPGFTLHWPWGNSNTATPPPPPTPMKNTLAFPRIPSPQPSSPVPPLERSDSLSSTLSDVSDFDIPEAAKPAAFPREPINSDFYKAFVQQWCFATTAPTGKGGPEVGIEA